MLALPDVMLRRYNICGYVALPGALNVHIAQERFVAQEVLADVLDGSPSNLSGAPPRNVHPAAYVRQPGAPHGAATSRRRGQTTGLSVVLLDDDRAARGELRDELARQRGIRVVGEAGRGAELFGLLGHTQPDVVVMDVLLRHDDGFDLIRRLRRHHPAVKVVVLSNQVHENVLLPALRAGAHGYLDRMDGATRIADALRLVCRDERVVPGQRAVTQVVRELERLAQADVHMRIGITAEDRNLLALVSEGLSNQDIAARIGCSLATVKRHLTQLFGKLQAPDRNSAISEALRQGVL